MNHLGRGGEENVHKDFWPLIDRMTTEESMNGNLTVVQRIKFACVDKMAWSRSPLRPE